jgi:hypothetical protein
MAIDTYLDSVTSQHRDKPKFIAWLSATLNKTDDVYNCIKTFEDAFDLDKAIGVQQDVLGRMIGTNRVLNIETDTISPVMENETYRLVQKAKIAQNNWDGSIPKIYELWDNMFDNLKLQIIDNQDMSMTAVIFGSIKELNELLIANGYIVPKPSTVRLNYIGKSDMDFKVYSSMLLCSKTMATIDMIQPPPKPIDFYLYSNMVMVSKVSSTVEMEGMYISTTDLNEYSKIILSSTTINTI